MSSNFTLRALRSHLHEHGYIIASDGDDIAGEMGVAAALLGLPHTPLFFVTVRAEGDLLTFSTSIMESVWSVFERGQMEFNCWLDDDGPRATIKEAPRLTAEPPPKPARVKGTGWVYPNGYARKAHFIDDGRSLCKNWLYLGSDWIAVGEPECCKGCLRRLS